ncbi:bifunctional proline dehydrogenase/L-glutamate gamma-semialdehyde dehydrogenase PutA [Celeribacter litoreus]|uniref:bifunctional proline dehydrogenase/L-glutamate gamma-semialdehyde dehydrogenase PutA n=1 Tax=Celeribacter litoreus TaxID=2876714 RepID=UPI001CCAD240|nr:bifunctional proline dehydrogenase/L-glutamate gamma-semialdehyde dehydrogenase PutA [Celeribacter litoreus]MCA0043191.1 bifunctional proline dehydrogenase/L-glutamate gamma-semialdehyde dehydrogenase PutA [Celeribacter litoreus]
MHNVTYPSLGFSAKYASESELLDTLISTAALSADTRQAISKRAAVLVERIRTEAKPTLMEHFLAEYGLSTREGVALMCLAEAMLRVPDTFTIDALIEDKIAPSEWNKHLGTAASSLVNASTWALMLTGKVLKDEQPGVAGVMRGAVKRLGEPVIRAAVGRAMKEMGRQFVLGETIEGALKRGRGMEDKGYTYSFDMLGEAARTQADAARYARDYANAIKAIGAAARFDTIVENPGISVKLSALHPRYEVAHEERVMRELVPVVSNLARQAKEAGIAFHIDAEEQDRLALSFKVIDTVLSDEVLAGWDGFGVVVQAYGKRAGAAIDELYAMANRYDRKMNIRLVKGAYWDTEMKLSQVAGMPGFPLFTTKAATDVSYICLAKKLFGMTDRLFPQFATHNAHTVAAVQELAEGRPFEFQRLHGMGERLHDIVLKETEGHCRIYAPVGAHQDLLAYLVRRLLENGANSSFVHQIVDENVSPEMIALDPFEALETAKAPRTLVAPSKIFGEERVNARGWDLTDEGVLADLASRRDIDFLEAAPITVTAPTGTRVPVINPATGDEIGAVIEADTATVENALDDAAIWSASPAERAAVLRRAADLYEANAPEIFSLLAREAGKNWPDAIGEVREAVDFLRYYAGEGEVDPRDPRGVITAISPWNFPLAIFTGQISAALIAGNAVLAKPAETTPLIAHRAVTLLHEAGVPRNVLQLLTGRGSTVGAALTSDPRIKGVVFTGSTDTAQRINRTMAEHLTPGTPLIAETGGLNAMIVDSTALAEQAVRDIVASAFQSAGQRCSALRCLYVQEDSAEHVINMIKGAMDELNLGNPDALTTDVGPVIDENAQHGIAQYIAKHANSVLHQVSAPETGTFIPPTMIKVNGINDLEREIFGPVLHVATFKSKNLLKVVNEINARGFGLTFGLHTRIDDRVQSVSDAIHVGNIYVNRNQIGAIVGSQPFGGEGLSGTGPKAGGPLYLSRFYAPENGVAEGAHFDRDANEASLLAALAADTPERIGERLMPGPTGELNRLTFHTRPPVLCLGPGAATAEAQRQAVEALGGHAVVPDGKVFAKHLAELDGFSGALWWGDEEIGRKMSKALASRDGAILPLLTSLPDAAHVLHERHMCVDTTAAGGNAALLAG